VTRRPHPALLYGLIALMISLWTVNYLAGKLALEQMDGLTLASFRLVFAGLIVIPIYFATPGARRPDRRDFWRLVTLGFLGAVVNQGGFTLGLSFTTTGHSSIIVGSAPILVLLLARLKGLEPLSAAGMFGMALSFTGITVLAAENGLHLFSGTLAGDLITLCGVAGFAAYTVYGKTIAAHYDAVAMITFNAVVGAILVAPIALWKAVHIHLGSIGWAGWSGILYMALMSSVVSYLIFYWALRHLAASRLAAFSYVQPVMVIVLGLLFLHERLTPNLVIGGGLALAGVVLTERGLGERVPPPDPA
jgi:drug/metabolite transporter (DMT)-like permease